MSRAQYCDDLDNWDLIRWRGQVVSATNGKRGQKFLQDILAALDAMPDKRLIRHELQAEDGQVCAIGALGVARHIDMGRIDPDEPDDVAEAFDIATPLARETVYMNDEHYSSETPEQRFVRMRAWVAAQIKPIGEPNAKR